MATCRPGGEKDEEEKQQEQGEQAEGNGQHGGRPTGAEIAAGEKKSMELVDWHWQEMEIKGTNAKANQISEMSFLAKHHIFLIEHLIKSCAIERKNAIKILH